MILYTTTQGKGGFVITVEQSHIHFFIEMLFQWCIFCLINKVLIQTSFFMLFIVNAVPHTQPTTLLVCILRIHSLSPLVLL